MSNRIRNTSRRLIDGDPLVWGDLKSFVRSRVKRNVAKHSSKVKQITDEKITTYKVNRYKAPDYGLSALVDPEYYSKQAGIEFTSADKVLSHYISEGAAKGYSPHRLFDATYYLDQLDETPKGTTPLEHFFNIGGNAGFSPSAYFDSSFYLSKYSWTVSQNPLAHYLCYGIKDGHNPFNLFDSNFYVRKSVGSESTARSPIEHYITEGWREGSNPHPLVDLEFMASQIWPGIAKSDWEGDPLKRYLTDRSLKKASPHNLFDPDFFCQALRDIDEALVGEGSAFDPKVQLTPMNYFLSPDSPRVNPSREFSAEQYKFQYPDLGNMNGLYHYARYGMDEGRSAFPSMSAAMNADLLRQSENEPTLLAPHQSVKDMFVAFMPREFEPGLDLLEIFLDACTDFRPDIVYCLPQFFRGGAEKYGSKLVNTLAIEAPEKKILVVATDGNTADSREWYADAPNVKYLTLPQGGGLDLHTNVLSRFITLMRPEWVINVNSKACWEAYEKFGKSMSINSKLTACLFCYDMDVNGSRVGYARDHIREVIPYIETIMIDNKGFCKTLYNDFSLHPREAEKLQYLYQPFEIESDEAKVKANWLDLTETVKAPRVLWPSRFHKQKQPHLLREIAIAMPDVDFLVWSPDSWNSKLAGGDMPSNITFTKEESTLAEMAKRDVSALLLCSAWEGLPTVLIESVEAGIPIVANDVGGVAEIVNEKTGYLVETHADAAGYRDAISALLKSPKTAAERRSMAFQNIKTQHGMSSYVARLKTIGLL